MKIEEEIVTLRVGLIGDYNPEVRAHVAIPKALDLAEGVTGCKSEATWVATARRGGDVEGQLRRFDALWRVRSMPGADMEGALSAIRFARVVDRPSLGMCGRFQHD